jgi:hypothetical protein
MGASAAGLTHLKSGYRIISETKRRNETISREISELIEPIMSGFIAKSNNYKLEETDIDSDRREETTYNLPQMPDVFHNLIQANQHLQEAVYWGILLELGQPRHLITMAPGVRKYVMDWTAAFGRWKAKYEKDDPVMKDWQLLLLAHHRMALLILRTLPPESDKMYGRAAADFRIMFAQLRTFLRSRSTELQQDNKSELLLKVHLGFIFPLFFIATQCRVNDIRHKALEALKYLKIIEGHWNSCVAYAIARKAVDLEAQYAESSPHRPTRIKLESVDRDSTGSLVMRYHTVCGTLASDEVATRTIEETVCDQPISMQWVCIILPTVASTGTGRILTMDCSLAFESSNSMDFKAQSRARS